MAETDIKRPRGRPRSVSIENTPSKALDKGLIALRKISESDGVSLNDLSLDLDMPMATLHRLLLTLESHGFVRQSKSDASWSIGIEAFRVGSAFPRAAKLLNVARPVLKELSILSGETANLGIMDQAEVIFLAQHETHHAIRAFSGQDRGDHGTLQVLAKQSQPTLRSPIRKICSRTHHSNNLPRTR